MPISVVCCASAASPAFAGAVCLALKNGKCAGLPVGLQLMKKSKKRNPT
ncbi:hypothetical protein [Hymenobacter metallilatus]|nr:hypothetical protein [Hymenobacter metallilatus]